MTNIEPTDGTSPWLSVIIPTYNGEKFLESCLGNVANQDLEGVEIIVSDDGSSDSSLKIIESHAETLPITLIHHVDDGNWIDNTNHGVRHARGEFLTFLHQDDLWLPDRLRSLAAAITRAPNVNFWIHDSALVDEDGRTIGGVRCPFDRREQVIASHDFVERLLVQNFIMMPSPVMRRSTYLACGGFDPAYWYASDWDLWLKAGLSGDVGYVPRRLAAFRVHRGSQTWDRSDQSEDIENQLTTVFERSFGNWREPDTRVRRSVRKASQLSSRTNIWFMTRLNGAGPGFIGLLKDYLFAGPMVVRRTIRDSRIIERASARLRVRISPH